jgi:hypothetical protein
MAVVPPLTAGEWLVVGDEGEQVEELQRQLQHLGYYEGEIDQRYGDITELAIREFQQAASRPDDGRVDHETWETLSREAEFAGYDPYSHPDATVAGRDVDAEQVSDDGEWRWDGAEWQSVDAQAHDKAAENHAEEPRHLSDDGRWEWDGADWKSADHDAGDQRTDQAPSIDLNSFPDVREGDSGEWVTYLHSMLASTGF